MIGIARSDINDRRVLFTNTGDKTGLHPAIIEKDFWVCYVLDYLFHRSEWKDALVFKKVQKYSASNFNRYSAAYRSVTVRGI